MDKTDNIYSFCDELIKQLEEKGFKNDRGWEKKHDETRFYSFVKGIYRFEIRLDWDKIYDFYKPIEITFLNCEEEWYGEPISCLMWMGQKVLHSFKKPFSQLMFDALCYEYEL